MKAGLTAETGSRSETSTEAERGEAPLSLPRCPPPSYAHPVASVSVETMGRDPECVTGPGTLQSGASRSVSDGSGRESAQD